MNKLFSYKNRPVHMGPYAVEKLARTTDVPNYASLAPMQALSFTRTDEPLSIVNAMDKYQATLDTIREGSVKQQVATIPADPQERSDHLKAFGYYCDASIMGTCQIPTSAWLHQPIVNPGVARLADTMANKQVKTLAAGIDVILAMVREAMAAPETDCSSHTHALVFMYEYPRDPQTGEAGTGWLNDAQAHRAALRAAESASVLAAYMRSLGYQARAHSASASNVDLGILSAAAGLTYVQGNKAINPFLGARYGLAVVTTDLQLAPDQYLQPGQSAPWHDRWLSSHNSARKPAEAFAKRRFADGAYPFESITRVDQPTTYIDAANVPRVPKRADMFARSLFGDMGPKNQQAARNGNYVRKSASAFAFRPALGAFVLLQDADKAPKIDPSSSDAMRNANNIKATAYWLGCDAVGISACPDWAYYSHNAAGEAITPYHDNAISIVIDQGHETMEGASGDDWISCAQSMRAYLRFSLLGGVLAEQIRNLGYSANVHTVMASDVIQPPLVLLSGLGEVSRIGEVILNPLLGPRLKAGTITTSMPMAHDKPIDFGLQKFCENCNKCARECPAGAITAGPKKMFNGYEIWKSDSQKCTTYRITTEGGAMCGRCMKTCPWNLEGLFKELPFRWVASNLPSAAKTWAKIDDALGNGKVNQVKKWWWDLEMVNDGPYTIPLHEVNERALQTSLNLKYEDQTLAVYPANLLPPPYPFPFPMDREAGIQAYDAMLSADEHKQDRARGVPPEHVYLRGEVSDAPVIQVVISKVEKLTDKITKYQFKTLDGSPLPKADAGAHVDVVVAPEFFRQYSLSSAPSNQQHYEIAVLREDEGRGGSLLMQRIFAAGRKVFISKPINHFPLDETAQFTYLMGGGIGITAMLAMAHRLHEFNKDFVMHYSCSLVADAAFTKDLQAMPWADKVQLHYSDQGTRADLASILQQVGNAHVYTCGPEVYMQAVLDTAAANGFDDKQRHMEYFSVPEQPTYENHEFTLKLAKSGRQFTIPADKTPTEVLLAAGISIEVKCADGICGVCKCGIVAGDVEHRDFVLSNQQRETQVILCQSRAAMPGGVLEVAL
ncbi:MAG TPA: NAD-binding oxidoreductase [Oceanospirillaceae bacterium]|nr:NAD-binding oxidoreductase [Oceanospirillaceae bacterium]